MNGLPLLPTLMLVAWLAPLAAFVAAAIVPTIEHRRRGRVSIATARAVAQVATACSVLSLGLALVALAAWVWRGSDQPPIVGDWFRFVRVGPLDLSAGYCLDTLSVVMTTVVTLVATCVHVYARGYFTEEMAPEGVVDSEVLSGTLPLQREGRLHRFYQHLSLFLFSMLGLVLSGNLAMTFVFWELVGLSSYLLIGFYYEREAAANAASKAMLVNRLADVGLLLGMIALWNATGGLVFIDGEGGGLLSAGQALRESGGANYRMLCWAGLGLFCGCLGKSAQFPLWTWLPDAMQGPTPVSALVHSATMVAAGVFLIGRVYPLLTPEVLVIVASVGALTLLIGAVLACAAADFKRVLAFSTISQLGYMMLAMGLGGWVAGIFHLMTHAMFKSLLFLAAGAVIHATHSGDLAQLGGLRQRMPRTAWLTGIGVLAIMGAGIPGLGLGLSGFYSKDLIFEQAIGFYRANSWAGWLLVAPTIGAALTAFYMGRLWLLTFAGKPRSVAAAEAHEAAPTLLLPMLVLAALAISAGWTLPGLNASLAALLDAGSPAPHQLTVGTLWPEAVIPGAHDHHAPGIKLRAGLLALGATAAGLALVGISRLRGRLANPLGAGVVQALDLRTLPAINRGFATSVRSCGTFLAEAIDRWTIDNSLIGFTRGLWRGGVALHRIETGSLRHYIVFLVLGVVFLGSLAILAVV